LQWLEVCINSRGSSEARRARREMPRPEGPKARGWVVVGGDSKPPFPPARDLGSAVSSLAGSGTEPRKKLVLVHFGASKITNFKYFAFVLDTKVFGRVGLKSQQMGGGLGKPEQVGLSPP